MNDQDETSDQPADLATAVPRRRMRLQGRADRVPPASAAYFAARARLTGQTADRVIVPEPGLAVARRRPASRSRPAPTA